MSTLQGSGRMITDGLVFYNDYTNPKCYISGNTTCDDLSGNQLLSTISGCTYSGNSLYFNGVAGCHIRRTDALNTGNDFTVSVWMQSPLSETLQRRALVANSYPYVTTRGWLFSTGGGGIQTGCFFLSIGNDRAYKVSLSGTLQNNKWYYLTGVAQSGGSNIELYKNNEQITQFYGLNLTGGTITYTYPQFNIGHRNIGVVNEPFTGNISLVQIYNRALSQQEITQNYNAIKSRFSL